MAVSPEVVASVVGAGASLASSAIGTANGYLQSYRNYKYAKKLAKYQLGLERQGRQTSFQDTRQSLEEAGYNPMLAVGQQANGLTPSTTNVGAPGEAPDIAGAMTSALSTVNQMKRNETLNRVDTQNAENNAIDVANRGALLTEQTRGNMIQNDIQEQTGMLRQLKEIDEIIARTDDYKTHSALNSAQKTHTLTDLGRIRSEIVKNLSEAVYTDTSTERNIMENQWRSETFDYGRRFPFIKSFSHHRDLTGFDANTMERYYGDTATALGLGRRGSPKGHSATSRNYDYFGSTRGKDYGYTPEWAR